MVQSWIKEQMPAQNKVKGKPQEMVTIKFCLIMFRFGSVTFFIFSITLSPLRTLILDNSATLCSTAKFLKL